MTRPAPILIGMAFCGALGAALAAAAPPAMAQEDKPRLPRFASLRSDQVNMRAGPGQRYPVDWVYMRRDLPVEITAEFDTWRRIRDPEGAEGWVHQSMLAGRRTMLVTQDRAPLRRTADDGATVAAYLERGVQGRLVQCPAGSTFCRVEVEGFQGWLRRGEFYGVHKDEAVD